MWEYLEVTVKLEVDVAWTTSQWGHTGDMWTAAGCVSQSSCNEAEPFIPEIITNTLSGDIRQQSNMLSVTKQEYHSLQHAHKQTRKYVRGCAEMCLLMWRDGQIYADKFRDAEPWCEKWNESDP